MFIYSGVYIYLYLSLNLRRVAFRYGHDLEFTRHDLWEGLSAELVANRKFALPSPCSDTNPRDYSCWPPQVKQEVAAGFVPRWRPIGAATLDAPYWSKHSALVTGDRGHSVHCKSVDGAACGVVQSSSFDGFDSGKSFGSALPVQAGKLHSLRVVLRGGATLPKGGAVSASIVTETGATVHSSTFVLDADHAASAAGSNSVGNGAWTTFYANFTPSVTTVNATLTLSSAGSGEWWLGSVSFTNVDNTWRGMRKDTVAALKATGFKGLMRYPGGCYAPFYRWKIGLLDPDERQVNCTPHQRPLLTRDLFSPATSPLHCSDRRSTFLVYALIQKRVHADDVIHSNIPRPPIETPPKYCSAVAGGVNAYSDGFMENGIGIDDYMASNKCTLVHHRAKCARGHW